ncbi:MAG: oligosaccharide flippase family protein [Acidobacteria bacterium]|nr:oligosaccharide flippase family protein [Acidobacteriota bacterium]
MQNTHISSRSPDFSHGHHLFEGTILVFMAEILLPLTGIITAAFLTRKLGAGDYGLLVLSSTVISWIELIINSLFSRATVKIVSDEKDWRPAGAAILRMHIYAGMAALAACWILAKPCAALLGEPKLALYLALFALDIPLFAIAHCHRSLLIGRGQYAERAKTSAGRWLARLILIIALVEMGFSLTGAILGNIGASLVEAVIARYYIRPSWFKKVTTPSGLWDYALPLFLSALGLRYMGMGLFLLKMLGASSAEAGIYGAAQNVSFVMPGILSVSLSPLLLSTLSRVLQENNLTSARLFTRNSIRAVLATLPFAVMAAVASDDLTVLLFGRHFADSGPLMSVLIFAGLGMIMINLLNAVLIACGNPSWILKLSAPLLPAAIIGHFIAIPIFGSMGAAAVTALVTASGALACLIAVKRRLQISFPASTLMRSLFLSVPVFLLMYFWPVHGIAVLAQIAVIAVLAAGGFMISGELRREEIRFIQSFFFRCFLSRR